MANADGFDLSSLPLQFLDAYPYSAFVLHVPVPYDSDRASIDLQHLADLPFQRQYANSGVVGPLDAQGRSTWASFLNPVWSSKKWKQLLRRRSTADSTDSEPWYRKEVQVEDQHGQLLPLLDLDAARDLGNWLSGVTEWRHRQARGRLLEERRRSGRSSASAPSSGKKRKDDGEISQGRRKAPRSLHQRFDLPAKGSSAARIGGQTYDGQMEIDEGLDRSTDLAGPSNWRKAASTTTEDTSASEPWDDIDEQWPSDITASQPLNLHFESLGLRLLLSKTPYPDPSNQAFSYLVILAMPCPESPRHFDLATPASELARFTLGPDTPSATELSAETTPSTAKGPNPPSSEVSSYFPPTEPIIIGQADTNQLGYVSRRPASDPLSVEYLLETKNWAQTPLGPRERWPQSLKTALAIVMAMPCQANLWWGRESLVMLYNQSYAAMVAHKHPQLFGQHGAVGWSEVSPALPLRDCARHADAVTGLEWLGTLV